MAGIGSTIGGALGGVAGTIAGPLGSAAGTALGGLAGGLIDAIPALVKTDAEKENERRLRELRRMRELGTLGLSEAEKQQLYTAQQGAAASTLRATQQMAKSAGAAGMATGAGAGQLQQAQLAQSQAETAAASARNVEAQNLVRKRELEAELAATQAAVTQSKQEALQAVTGTVSGALAGGLEEYGLQVEKQGKMPTAGEVQAFANLMGVSTDDAKGLLEFRSKSGMSAADFAELTKGKN